MTQNYQTQIDKGIAQLVRKELIEETSVKTSIRQRFFNRYSIRIVMGVAPEDFLNFDERVDELKPIVEKLAQVVVRKETFEILLYSSDPKILRSIVSCKKLWINTILLIDPKAWTKKFPKPKAKPKNFFGTYQYRIGFKNPAWARKLGRDQELTQLEIDYKLVTRIHQGSKTENTPLGWPKECFMYVSRLPEVLVIKLLFGSDIAEVDKR